MVSIPGVLGAAVGATIGWINGRIVAGVVAGRLRGMDRSATAAERAAFEGRLRLFRRLVIGILMAGTSAVGYAFGVSVGG